MIMKFFQQWWGNIQMGDDSKLVIALKFSNTAKASRIAIIICNHD